MAEHTIVSPNKEVDVIIVGGGLTGCLLAFLLLQKNQSVFLIDKGQENASSSIAAGIINPVTGNQFIKSWNIDVFLPKAIETYQQIEKKLNIKIVFQQNIVRHLPGAGAENHWESRKLDPGYEKYICEQTDVSCFLDEVNLSGNYAEVTRSARIDISLFIKTFKNNLLQQGLAWNEKFVFEDVILADNLVQYRGIRAKNIIFCEGFSAVNNPFFVDLPFALTRGYATTLRLENSKIDKMFKDDLFLVPTGKDHFWVGGGYENIKNPEMPPSDDVQDSKIDKLLCREYRLVEKKHAIRPTTKTRRPFMRQHKTHPNMFLLNGMGTKGTSMAPFFTQKLADYLCGESTDFPSENDATISF
jgi:glycine oxidase